ncbi:MAG: glycyl-tRNA ligase subunit beta, partial [Sphingomonas bacterium]|nr:glycyl-tRNA ligase subunit beta [Sphingomonas bacterium]
ELLSEEIPARMQDKACADLARLFADEIAKAGLAASAIDTFATPRRLALIARGLPLATEAVREETKGPRASAPEQAIEGFLRKTGLTRDTLVERDGVFFAVVDRPGRDTAAVLAAAIPAIVRGFPWPKSMRWGAASADPTSLRWVRPLHGIIALLGEQVVPIEVDGVTSGATTVGHRFHHPDRITIRNADDYAGALRAGRVILDAAERRAIIRERAAAAAAAAGLSLVPDEGLVIENAGLTEWPVPLLGRFDPAFLELPREVIQLTMRTNQKYFACTDAAGTLAPAFLCTANIEAADGGAAIVAGNGKVLAARLSDARFFWEQDRKVPLAQQAKKLGQIVFHEKLGTVADKVDRVAKLARWLVEEGIVGADKSLGHPELVSGSMKAAPASPDGAARMDPDLRQDDDGVSARARLADMAEQAARLAKADLVTGMVGEFPELQGLIGGYYARAEGCSGAVADAIRDQYRPVGQGDDVPSAPVSVALALADKLDTLGSFAALGEWPTGSKDPFALRRAALGIIRLIVENRLRLPLGGLADAFLIAANRRIDRVRFLDFFADRLKVQQREAGVRHDLIDAVFALGGEDDLVRLLARVKALQAFVATEDGANLLAGYRRAANIVRIEAKKDADAGVGAAPGTGADYAPEPAEAALIAALNLAEPAAAAAVTAEDFEAAMAALARLRPAVDAFFDQVTVNDPDPVKRSARLALLDRIRVAVHNVADFSKIEG